MGSLLTIFRQMSTALQVSMGFGPTPQPEPNLSPQNNSLIAQSDGVLELLESEPTDPDSLAEARLVEATQNQRHRD